MAGAGEGAKIPSKEEDMGNWLWYAVLLVVVIFVVVSVVSIWLVRREKRRIYKESESRVDRLFKESKRKGEE